MKLAFTTTFDSREISKWSGTPLHMVNGFLQQGIAIERIGGLTRQLPSYFKLKQFWKKIVYSQRESPRFNVFAAKAYSQQIKIKMASLKVDAIIAPQVNPIAYLDSPYPQILWTDSLYASLLNFYPSFSNHSKTSVEQGNTLVKECLSRCRLAIFSSDWAAQSAIQVYGIHSDKIRIVPFGANIECQHSFDTIRHFIKARSKHVFKLLFIGKYWDRKGGEVALKVANALNAAGENIELHLVGCQPPSQLHIPKHVHCHGFIPKSTAEGLEKISKLFQESHLLFVPSRAEAYGIVFCEANAFGVPCIASNVGGIPTIIKNHINGMMFETNVPTDTYCKYIIELMQNKSRYDDLALSAFSEYETRLNWKVATKNVSQFINEIL